MKKLIGYKTFKTQEEFRQWQIDNPVFGVISVIPFNVEASVTGESDSYELAITTSAFVTYIYDNDNAEHHARIEAE